MRGRENSNVVTGSHLVVTALISVEYFTITTIGVLVCAP